jgi:NDP-sugar pyrophosphorylase family protein
MTNTGWWQDRVAGPATGKRAIILAGGKGTRLRPFTVSFPKPLMPLGVAPVVEVLMRQLVAHGVTDVTLALGHLAELVRAYFDHRWPDGAPLKLRYVQEVGPSGTAGAISLVEGLDETFLVMNGDIVTDLDFHALVGHHRARDAILTVATHRRRVQIDFGVLEADHCGRITAYREKPELENLVSMGIYVYEPRVLDFIDRGEYLDFPDLVLRLLSAGETVCAYETDCQWLDIGRPSDYARAQALIETSAEDVDRV